MHDGPRVRGSAARVVRWGLPDALMVWFVALVAGLVATILTVSARGLEDAEDVADDAYVAGIGAAVQVVTMVLALRFVSHAKGRGSLAQDFGLDVRRSDWWCVPLGFGLQLLLALALLPIAAIDDRRQNVVEVLEDSSGLALALLVVTAVIGAPIAEELLFRGLLLRALLRRTGPTEAVALSALVFAIVHPLLDIDAITSFPAFVGLGMVAGVVTVRTARVGPAILLHAGFNLVTGLVVLAG
jgi:membrane protease YdiL (CAAX protease family)